MTKVKYHTVKSKSSDKSEHEIFIDDLFDRRNCKQLEMTTPRAHEAAFDFTTINDYKSIYKYTRSSQLTRADGTEMTGSIYI